MALRGVNLGGWLVLERWITPSLFTSTDAKDEYSFMASPEARTKLRKHQQTFITEQDFKWLAEQSVQAVRLPVGHWVFGDEAPYASSINYVDKAFLWAQKYGLKVLIDLHAAPGSQNGRNHSGRAGSIDWPANAEHREATLMVLDRLAQRYANHPALLGISLLNEPSHTISLSLLEAFYSEAYKLVRKRCGPDVWVIFSDSLKPKLWRHRLPTKQYPGLYIDYHHYQIYRLVDQKVPGRLQVWRARFMLPRKLRGIMRYHPAIIGEWSLALHSNAMSALNDSQKDALWRSYDKAQRQAFKNSAAWFFWTYKMEGSQPWSFRSSVEHDLLPRE